MGYAKLIFFTLTTSVLTGCATLRGAPPAPFSVKDIWSTQQVQVTVQSLSGNCLSSNPIPANGNEAPRTPACVAVSTEGDRNAAAHLLLALVDTEYSDFTQKFVYGKQHAQASTNFLRLLMTVAGGLTQSTGVKDNYLAGASLLTGGDAIVDSEYLFKGTAQALVSQMDATRAKMRTDINKKLRLLYSDYPGSSALADIQVYYRAGTIVQAVADAQKNSAVIQSEQEENQRRALDALLLRQNR